VRLVNVSDEPASIEAIAGKAWAFRHWVECDANLRFTRLAGDLEAIGTPAPLVELARSAASDERKHAGYCAEQAERYRYPLRTEPDAPTTIVPPQLSKRKGVLYEIAAVGVSETESTVMLLALREEVKGHDMRALLKLFAEDEVSHARLAWAVLESHRPTTDLSFLARWIPWMLRTTVGDSFAAPKKGHEDHALIEHGVLPYSLRRKVFIDTLADVVLPGLDKLGIDSGPTRAWLEASVTLDPFE
jgi:hypothetical protein